MAQEEHTFKISYKGVVVTVKPISTDDTMLYIVELPGERILLETGMDDSREYWIENGDAETDRANEIGALIESKLM